MLCLVATTAIYLGLSSWLVSRYKRKRANYDQQFGNRSTPDLVDECSFINGCFAFFLNVMLEILFLVSPDTERIQMCAIICFYILLHAWALLHLWRLLNEIKPKDIKGFGKEKLKGKEGEMADLDALKGKEFASGLENTPSKESLGCTDSSLSSGGGIKGEVQQDEAMHVDVELEPKEMETGMENWDFINFEDDIGMPDLEEFTEIVKEDVKSVEENYGKNLLEKVEKKLEKVKEKYMEEYKTWKEQENCLFAMLSREITRAELYCVQARENEEKLGELEDEKNELMGKLCTANVKSQLYRDLLHDAVSTQN